MGWNGYGRHWPPIGDRCWGAGIPDMLNELGDTISECRICSACARVVGGSRLWAVFELLGGSVYT